jgi:hypothetical protein
MSGTVNNAGTPNNLNGTGPVMLDNTASPGKRTISDSKLGIEKVDYL